MGRPKKSAPNEIEPEDESQDMPEEEPGVEEEEDEPTAATQAASMSKADACRAALAAGIETTEEAMEFTRTKFGVEIKPTDFSLYKSKAKAGSTAARGSKPGRKPKGTPSPAVEGYLAPPPKQRPSGGEADLIESLETLKPLIASMGAEKVKRLVDLLG